MGKTIFQKCLKHSKWYRPVIPGPWVTEAGGLVYIGYSYREGFRPACVIP